MHNERISVTTHTAGRCLVYPETPYGIQPSVTSIISILDKPQLKDWAANCAVDWLINNPQDFDNARKAHKLVSDAAKDTGTDIHALCSRWLLGESIDEDSLETQTTHTLLNAFKEWCLVNTIEPVYSEVIIHGPGYSGTCDLIAYRTDPKTQVRRLGLYDIKTAKGSYYPEWGLQLAAYANAAEDMAADGALELNDSIEELGIIKLNKETLKCNYKEFTSQRDRLFAAFIALKDFYWLYNDLESQIQQLTKETEHG